MIKTGRDLARSYREVLDLMYSSMEGEGEMDYCNCKTPIDVYNNVCGKCLMPLKDVELSCPYFDEALDALKEAIKHLKFASKGLDEGETKEDIDWAMRYLDEIKPAIEKARNINAQLRYSKDSLQEIVTSLSQNFWLCPRHSEGGNGGLFRMPTLGEEMAEHVKRTVK